VLQLVLGWFPSVTFANAFGIIALAALVSDQVVPRLAGARRLTSRQSRDRGSFVAILLSAQVGMVGGILLRTLNIGVVPPWVQFLAVVLIIAGTLIREWAILVLGRFFSRVVEIEEGHHLITDGPYRGFVIPPIRAC
jgi:protein-S-isoprenylcysteine O-methyltransferase Ste14